MKILVLGGSGFLSGRFVKHALDAGHQLICITRGLKTMPDGVNQTIHMERQEIPETLPDEITYDVVIDFIGINAQHLRQTVSLARHCQRLVFISSDYVYHPAHRKLFLREEEAIFSDFDDYGGAKRRAEEVVLQAESIQSIILRPPHIYGPGSWPGTIPKHGRRATLLEEIQRGDTLHLLNGGLGLIQPIHVDDLARIIVTLIHNEQAYGNQFTAAGPDLMTHLHYYNTLAERLNKPLKVHPYCPDGQAQDVNNYVGGHRCYHLGKLQHYLPGFLYTPFQPAMAEWVQTLQRG
ncbi:MAG: NAD-dependent epimerase/dehydratase family protein [Magnetococcales bacterium]|nr:NAD-dependent epimerase/dehydratase family protein [Magnetococcales bacterium]